jgi:dynein heavy chain, axonemal
LKQSLEEKETEWKDWCDSPEPETTLMPAPYDEKLDDFKSLLVLKIIRPDRVVNGIKRFIENNFKKKDYI